MNSTHLGRGTYARALLAGTGMVAAMALAGCAGSLTAGGQVSTGQTRTTGNSPAATGGVSTPAGSMTPIPGGQGAGTGTGGNTVAAPRSPSIPECKASTLALSFGGSDAGMSQQEQVLRFTNVGKRSCVIVGFPGVSYVAGDNGQQVGAPAVRTGRIGAQITLAPGAVASTVIHSVDVGVFDATACRPTPVRGYRIYAPDDRASMFVPLHTGVQGCAGTTPDPQLSVVTVKAGAGDPDRP